MTTSNIYRSRKRTIIYLLSPLSGHELSYSAFKEFLDSRADDLAFISRQSRGEVTIGDLGSDAWLVALEIANSRGHAVDFESPSDQDEILRRLYNRSVKFTEKKVRNAFKLDRDHDPNENKSGSWSNRAVAPPGSEPLDVLLKREEEAARRDIQSRLGYSQASAYVLLLFRFESDIPAVSAHLAITPVTFVKRLRHAVQYVRIQPSLFDKTERLDPNFLPPPNRRYVLRPRTEENIRQLQIRLNRQSNLRYFLSSAYNKLLAFISAERASALIPAS